MRWLVFCCFIDFARGQFGSFGGARQVPEDPDFVRTDLPRNRRFKYGLSGRTNPIYKKREYFFIWTGFQLKIFKNYLKSDFKLDKYNLNLCFITIFRVNTSSGNSSTEKQKFQKITNVNLFFVNLYILINCKFFNCRDLRYLHIFTYAR